MGMLKFISVFSVILICALIFMGHYKFIEKRDVLIHSQHIEQEDEDPIEEVPYKEIQNVILTENEVTLKNGEAVTLKLHMLEERYFDEENASYIGKSTGVDNYVGIANWEIYKGDTMIFSAPITLDVLDDNVIILNEQV